MTHKNLCLLALNACHPFGEWVASRAAAACSVRVDKCGGRLLSIGY